MSRPSLLIAFIVLSLVVAELAARATIDIKLYGSDTEVGYWLLPNQSGGSLLVGSYAINSDGFGVAEPFDPSAPNDVILIGDSHVMGTSGLNQHERLGPMLEQHTGWKVWPLAAGSWALANQLRMVHRKQIDGVEAIIFILNARDLDKPSQWRNEYDLPRREPSLYLPYAVQKVLPKLRNTTQHLPVRKADLKAEWSRFRRTVNVPVVIIGYDSPKMTLGDCEWMPSWLDAPTLCFDPLEQGGARSMIDTVHLNAVGNKNFARFIADGLENEVESGR